MVRLSAATRAFSDIRTAARHTPFAALRAAVPAPTGRTGRRSAFPCLHVALPGGRGAEICTIPEPQLHARAGCTGGPDDGGFSRWGPASLVECQRNPRSAVLPYGAGAGAPTRRAVLAACGKTHTAFDRRSIPAEPRRCAPLIVAFRSKYTRYSSLTRLVSRTPTGRTGPRRSPRSRGFHHRLLAQQLYEGDDQRCLGQQRYEHPLGHPRSRLARSALVAKSAKSAFVR